MKTVYILRNTAVMGRWFVVIVQLLRVFKESRDTW